MIVLESLILGFYFYLAQQLIFLVRFGKFNSIVGSLDIFLYAVGVISSWLVIYLIRGKSRQERNALLIAFVIAQPIAFVGALMGGLIGGLGIVVFGLAPTLLALLVTNSALKKRKSKI